MNTLLLTKPQLMLVNGQSPLDLGDGLVLRFITPADVDAVAQFNGRIHGDERPDKFDPMVAAWTRDFCSEQHPACGPSNVTVVEDTRTNKIVSSMCLIPQTWTYAGIPFEVGRPEAVGTDPDYRRRGLVRMQFEVLHTKSEAMGHLLQGITGIAWYYRQFDYEYALDLGGGRMTYLDSVPALKEGETEAYRLRPVTAQTLPDDLPLLKGWYEQDCARSLVVCPRPDWMWNAIFSWYSPDSFCHQPFYIIETAEGRPAGYVVTDREMWDDLFMVNELVAAEGQSLRAILPSLLRALKPLAESEAKRQTKTVRMLFWKMGAEHPLFAVAPDMLHKSRRPYAWYIRVPDVPAFLRRIAPALEARLARSPLAGHTGELKLNGYQRGLRLVFDQGRLTTVEAWRPENGHQGNAAFPPLVFLRLMLGHASLTELRDFYADCWAQDEADVLLSVLFPKQHSCVQPVG